MKSSQKSKIEQQNRSRVANMLEGIESMENDQDVWFVLFHAESGGQALKDKFLKAYSFGLKSLKDLQIKWVLYTVILSVPQYEASETQ